MTRQLSFCVHAHFHEPLNVETAEAVYLPNLDTGNFARLSFDIGNGLLDSLQLQTPKIYRSILSAARTYRKIHHTGNVLAAPLFESPMPLLSARDRMTQLQQGKMAAKASFGYVPKGVFLPELAADHATLQAVIDAGFEFTLLRSSQIEGLPRRGGAGPYRIALPSGDTLTVFVVNDDLSASMINEMVERGGSGYWAHQELCPHYRHAGELTLVYASGELLGRHGIGEAQFMKYLLEYEALRVGFQPTTLERHLKRIVKPTSEVGLLDHVPEGKSRIQFYLQVAMHVLSAEVDALLFDVVGNEAWKLRDQSVIQMLRKPWVPHARILASQMILQEARAAVARLETDSRVTATRILKDVAQAIAILRIETGVDLSTVFSKRIPANLGKQFSTLFDEEVQKHATLVKANKARIS